MFLNQDRIQAKESLGRSNMEKSTLTDCTEKLQNRFGIRLAVTRTRMILQDCTVDYLTMLGEIPLALPYYTQGFILVKLTMINIG